MVDIHQIRKDLDVLEEELVARVPEHLFKSHILPLIAGDEGHTDLNVWAHLAGSIFNKIAVVDPGNRVLFTLPSIATTPKTDSERDPRKSLYEIMMGYEARTRMSPVYARNFLDASLEGRIILQKRDIDSLKLIDEILVKYGRKPHLPANFGKAAPRAEESEDPAGDIGDDL